MSLDEGQLLWGLIFGSVGLGYIVYGRRQRNIPAFGAGIALSVLPYFVQSAAALVISAIVLMALPRLLRHWF